MKKLCLYGLLWLFPIVLCATTYAQTKPMPKTGTVSGDDRPIAGITVRLAGDTLAGTSNGNGLFLIRRVPVGYNTLYVAAEGFHAVTTESFLVTASDTAVVNIALDTMQVALSEVVVAVSPLAATTESPVSMRRIGTEEIDMTPGANRDISKVVQSAPGVIATAIQRNDVLVRGGGANENKYYLDGIEIPVLNHFAVQGGSGGNASLVNTDLLRSVNFYTGAFPAAFGNGLSSVMDMRMRDGNPTRFKGKLILGASDFGINFDTPVSRNGKTTLLASYRRSYLQMLFSVLGLPFLPTYNDYQFKLTSKLGASDEFYLIGLGSFDYNRLNTGLKDPDDDQKYILGYLPENRSVATLLRTNSTSTNATTSRCRARSTTIPSNRTTGCGPKSNCGRSAASALRAASEAAAGTTTIRPGGRLTPAASSARNGSTAGSRSDATNCSPR